MQMETFTKENGKMTKHMVKAPILMETEDLSIMVIGMKMNNMAMVLKYGRMVLSMKDNIEMERNMVKVYSLLLKEALTMESLLRMRYAE
jgi:hypothetical protein